jgi:hypothetical protein
VLIALAIIDGILAVTVSPPAETPPLLTEPPKVVGDFQLTRRWRVTLKFGFSRRFESRGPGETSLVLCGAALPAG